MTQIGKCLYGVMIVLALLGGAACSGEEPLPEPEPTPIVPEPEEDDGILEAVTITIGASNTIETRFNDDPNALEHEFMNSLIAFIVNGDTIEAVINATETDAFKQSLEEMGPGNVNLYSQEVDITPGPKTIYAFANMDKVKRVKRVGEDTETSFLTTLIGLKVGDTWPTAYATAVIDDPAATVNFEGDDPGFIPMSLKENVTVTVAGQSVSLSLVRLVSRVSVELYNGQGTEITVKDFKMSDFADRVNLFASETAPAKITYKSYPFEDGTTSGDLTVKVKHNTAEEIATFYINETLGREPAETPFELSLTVGEKEMTGQTVCTSIPRNHILPLTLSLSDTHVGLAVVAQVAPIGGYPFEVYLSGEDQLPVNGNVGNYAVALPEGCVFTVTGTIEGSSGTSTQITDWTWTNENENLNLVETSVNDNNVLTGYLTALPGQEVKLGFSIQTPVASKGSLTIHTKPVGDSPWDGDNEFGPVESEALRSWSQPVRWSEFIPLRMANPE